MTISNEDIKHLAKLSCLKLDQSKIDQVKDKLTRILDLIHDMNKVNTQNITPLAHPLDLSQPLREDKITAKDEREQLQKNVEYTENGFYIVPQFIETE